MKTILFAAAALAGTAAHAQAPAQQPDGDDPAKAFIDASYARLDADGNGAISRAEFDTYMRGRLAAKTDEIDAAMAGLDSNRDGKLSPAEVKSIKELAANFTPLDQNKDGFVSRAELQAAIVAGQLIS